MKDNLDRAYILIDKYHSGQATAEEMTYLEQWRNQSSGNYQVYMELIQILDLVKGLKDWKQFDQQRAWGQFQFKIGQGGLKFSWKTIAAIAAIFLLVFTATFWNKGQFKGELDTNFISGTMTNFSILEDGSELFLAPTAIITKGDFSKDSRIISSQGNYFVNVEHNPESPFNINTENIEIQVLGTSFIVEEDNERTTVKVRDGKVRIRTADGTSYLVGKDEQFELKGNNVSISKLKNYDWGLYSNSLEDVSIYQLLDELSSQFDHLRFNASSISKECRITTKIDQSTILEILDELSLIFNVNYKIENGIVIVEAVSC